MYEQQPPVERTPIPENDYKPVEGDIGEWDYQSQFTGGHGYVPMQFDFESLMKFYYQQQQQQQGQAPMSAQQQLVNELQSYGRI